MSLLPSISQKQHFNVSHNRINNYTNEKKWDTAKKFCSSTAFDISAAIGAATDVLAFFRGKRERVVDWRPGSLEVRRRSHSDIEESLLYVIVCSL